MRLLVLLSVVALAAPAVACPTGAVCAAIGEEAPRQETPGPRRAKQPVLRLESAVPGDRWNLRIAPPKRPAVEMPWIWQALRQTVYKRLPTYQREQLSFTLSPVIVAGSFDTVPGFGLAGHF